MAHRSMASMGQWLTGKCIEDDSGYARSHFRGTLHVTRGLLDGLHQGSAIEKRRRTSLSSLRARPFRGELTLICVVTLLTSAATLVVPWFADQLFGELSGEIEISLGQTLASRLVAAVAMTVPNIGIAILSEIVPGQITPEGKHVRSLNVQHLRRQIGYAPSVRCFSMPVWQRIFRRAWPARSQSRLWLRRS